MVKTSDVATEVASCSQIKKVINNTVTLTK